MPRIVVIGNAGGGKSTLARLLALRRGLPHVEIDRLLWQEGWVLTPADVYDREHSKIIREEQWIIDGLGQQASISHRIGRATAIILIDMPLWMHFWLAAERQIAWASGRLENAPGGIAAMPPTEALFKTIWDVEQSWMPGIRALCAAAERQGTAVTRLLNVEQLNAFTQSVA
jgi:adenylate kinase family enzyme